MKIQVDENWWKDLFDDIYLLTDARSVCDKELTYKEVDFLEEAVLHDKSALILDMCGGQGRHSIELARRGFKNVTVLDFSQYLIEHGREEAQKNGLEVRFIKADARKTDLPSNTYQHIIIMASSFGYFPNERENQLILNEAFRLLLKNGTLLLDLPNREYVLTKFRPFSSHKVNDDITASRRRVLGDDIIYSTETVTSKSNGLVREKTYCTRLYSLEKITGLLHRAGFSDVHYQNDFMSRNPDQDFGCMTNRMVVTAKKT